MKSLCFNGFNVYPPRAACKHAIALFVLVFALISGAAQAGSADIARALKAMQKDQWTLARQIVTDSKDPVAAKLYLWMYYRDDKITGDFSGLSRFIKDNPDWPGMKGLKEKAEKTMPGNLSAAEVVSWFTLFPPETAKGLSRYLEALMLSGKKDLAKQTLSTWWAEKLATRDEQRMIYTRYGGLLDNRAHRRRLDTLLFSKQFTNARGIAQVLGKGYPELVEARIGLAEESPGVNALLQKIPGSLQDDPGLLYERLRWRRRNDLDMDAIKIIHNHPPVKEIQNPEDWWKEQHILIRRMMEEGRYESAYHLARKHFQTEGAAYADAEWLAGWLALRFMNKPQEAYDRFDKLYSKVETPISRARAAYWAGRAAEKMNKSEQATEWYRTAAKQQTVFYGQLAGEKLGMAEALPNAAPPVLSSADLSSMNNAHLIRAARFLHDADMDKQSSDFIDAYIDAHKTPQAYRFGAELSSKLGYYREALKIAKDATKEGLFLTAQSYPVITDKLKNVGTEWALVHAIIRQESMFDPGATSPVGALGMMQLMPATARQVAAKKRIAFNVQALTSNPSHNIRLGSAYMDSLLERFDGSYVLAIAAYNAGPSNVSKWIKEFGDPRTASVDTIDWVEKIPFPETRNYVQRVLEAVYVYRLRLKGVQKTTHHEIHVAMAKR